MKIAIITAIWQRPEITEYVLAYYKNIIECFKGDINIKMFIAGSESGKSKNLSEKYGAEYVEIPNTPLAAKLNASLLLSKQWKPDGVLCIGSDDLVSYNSFNFYKGYLKHNINPVGFLDCLIAWDDKIGYWQGYEDYRVGLTLGAGRLYPVKLLDALNWNVWGKSKRKTGMDGENSILMESKGIKFKAISMEKMKGQIVCLQSNHKITNLIKYKKTMPGIQMLDPCFNKYELQKLLL